MLLTFRQTQKPPNNPLIPPREQKHETKVTPLEIAKKKKLHDLIPPPPHAKKYHFLKGFPKKK